MRKNEEGLRIVDPDNNSAYLQSKLGVDSVNPIFQVQINNLKFESRILSQSQEI